MPTLNSHLKQTRKLRGLSQLQLASRAGVSARTIQFAESGKPLSDTTIRCIAEALELQVDQLLRIDSDCGQDAFAKLPWSIGDRFHSNQLADQGSLCRDEEEVIQVVRNLRENFAVQIQKWGSTQEQVSALQRDDAMTSAYFRYEQRYLDIWRRNPACLRVDRVQDVLCGVSIVLPITESCFEAFRAGSRGLLDVTAEDLCDQSQKLLLDSMTEFVNQSKRPWYRITESLSFISVAQIASLAEDSAAADFEMISFSASPLNERRLVAAGFEALEATEPEFNHPIFVFSDDHAPHELDGYTKRSTLKHFTHLIRTVSLQSMRRRMVRSVLSLFKRRANARRMRSLVQAA